MTVSEAAEKIGISTSKLYQLVGARAIPAHRVRGEISFLDADVQAYLDLCRVGAAAPVALLPACSSG
jgi:excisionase family DNA binding protein